MKYLHTMIRVTDLKRSLRFYRDVLGFRVVDEKDFPEEKFTLVFLRAPGDGDGAPCLELTYNYGVTQMTRGDAFGHLAYEVESMDEIATRLKKSGLSFSWGPGTTPSGKRAMAFLDDPDGYEIELLGARPLSL